MSTFDPGPLARVSSRPDGRRWTLVLVRDLGHPPEKVWPALVEPEQLSRWAPFTADRDLRLPGEATLTMIDGETPVDLPATVRRAEPPVLLEYTWGDDLLRWELEATATGTRLTLAHTVDGRATMADVAAGWHLCLVVAEHLLDGDPIAPISGKAAMRFGWAELRGAYEAALGTASD